MMTAKEVAQVTVKATTPGKKSYATKLRNSYIESRVKQGFSRRGVEGALNSVITKVREGKLV